MMIQFPPQITGEEVGVAVLPEGTKLRVTTRPSYLRVSWTLFAQ